MRIWVNVVEKNLVLWGGFFFSNILLSENAVTE